MIELFRRHGSEIGRLAFEHLWLTVSAMLFAALIGLPLGVFLSRRPRWAGIVIGFANVIQTVPSLALFGLLLPVPLLGENAARLAIVALTGYALLPILRNTYAGITSVDPQLIDVGRLLLRAMPDAPSHARLVPSKGGSRGVSPLTRWSACRPCLANAPDLSTGSGGASI